MGAGGGRRGGGRGGFSLIELLAVLLLAGMLVSLVVPSLSATLESSRLRSGASDVRSTLSLARALAAAGARERSVTFDLEKGEYGVDGGAQRRSFPDGIGISRARVGEETIERGVFRVRFFPDGSADETEIEISSGGGGTLRVGVEPLTGTAEAGA